MGVKAKNKWHQVVPSVSLLSPDYVRGPNIDGLGFKVKGWSEDPSTWFEKIMVVATLHGVEMPGLAADLLEDLRLYPYMGERRPNRAYPTLAYATELVPE